MYKTKCPMNGCNRKLLARAIIVSTIFLYQSDQPADNKKGAIGFQMKIFKI